MNLTSVLLQSFQSQAKTQDPYALAQLSRLLKHAFASSQQFSTSTATVCRLNGLYRLPVLPETYAVHVPP